MFSILINSQYIMGFALYLSSTYPFSKKDKTF